MRITLGLLILAACSNGSAAQNPVADAADLDVLQRNDAGDSSIATNDAGSDAAPGVNCKQVIAGSHVFSCNGLDVTVTAPAACATQTCGAILDVHGLGMDADTEDLQDNLRAIGNAAGYVVVQPSAPTGRTVYGPTWYDSDDTAVFGAFMDVVAAWKIDPKRVHVTGFSQGGYMTWRLVCAHSDVIASAAPGAAGTSQCPNGNFNGSCSFSGSQTPKQPIDILFVAGAKDAIVPSSCTTPMVDAVVAAWGGSKQTIASDATFTRDRYIGTAGRDFEVITHAYTTDPQSKLGANAGHCVPGATGKNGSLWDDLACKLPVSFTWGTEVLAFFKAHPKK